MLSKQEAENLVQNLIDKRDSNLVVIPEDTVELNFGWIIYFDTKKYVLKLKATYGIVDPIDHLWVGGFPLMVIDKFKKQKVDYLQESNLTEITSIKSIKTAILAYQSKNNYEQSVEKMFSPNTIYAYKKEHSEAKKLWKLCFGYHDPEVLTKYKFLNNNLVRTPWKFISEKYLRKYAINKLHKIKHEQ